MRVKFSPFSFTAFSRCEHEEGGRPSLYLQAGQPGQYWYTRRCRFRPLALHFRVWDTEDQEHQEKIVISTTEAIPEKSKGHFEGQLAYAHYSEIHYRLHRCVSYTPVVITHRSRYGSAKYSRLPQSEGPLPRCCSSRTACPPAFQRSD